VTILKSEEAKVGPYPTAPNLKRSDVANPTIQRKTQLRFFRRQKMLQLLRIGATIQGGQPEKKGKKTSGEKKRRKINPVH